MRVRQCYPSDHQDLSVEQMTERSGTHMVLRGWLAILMISLTLINPFLHVIAASDHITLQLPRKHQFEFAGYYAAKELGYYEQLGREIVIAEYQAGMNVIEEVTTGRAEFALVSSSPTASFLSGAPIRLLANIYKHPALVLLSHEDAGIQRPADLRGKRLMLTLSERESPEFQTFLASNAIAPGEIIFVEHTMDPGALLRGVADVMSASRSGQVFDLQQMGIPFHSMDLSSGGIDFYGDGLITSAEICEEDPDLVRYFRDVSLIGWYYALSHTEELVDLILDQYAPEKSREALLYEAQETIKLVDADSFLVGSVDPQRIQRIAKDLASYGLGPSLTSIEAFIFDPASPLEIDSSEMELSTVQEDQSEPVHISLIIVMIMALIVLLYLLIKFSKISKIRARLKDRVSREESIPTILAVDDEPAILDTLTELLKQNYKVKVAPSGEIALKIAQTSAPPDLILLDVMMPGMSGFEVAASLQSHESTKDIPIIFVTGRTDEESITEGYRVGGVDYVPKPFNPDELLARVETHLSLRDAQGQVADISRSLDS